MPKTVSKKVKSPSTLPGEALKILEQLWSRRSNYKGRKANKIAWSYNFVPDFEVTLECMNSGYTNWWSLQRFLYDEDYLSLRKHGSSGNRAVFIEKALDDLGVL